MKNTILIHAIIHCHIEKMGNVQRCLATYPFDILSERFTSQEFELLFEERHLPDILQFCYMNGFIFRYFSSVV